MTLKSSLSYDCGCEVTLDMIGRTVRNTGFLLCTKHFDELMANRFEDKDNE